MYLTITYLFNEFIVWFIKYKKIVKQKQKKMLFGFPQTPWTVSNVLYSNH